MRHKILLDNEMQTDHLILTRRHNIEVISQIKKTALAKEWTFLSRRATQ